MLIAAYTELLNKHLPPRYVAHVEERVYIAPDDDPETEQQRVPDVWINRDRDAKTKPVDRNGAAAIADPIVVTTLRDDETHERRVEIRTTDTEKLVAVIELLSPANKVNGSEGRKSFLEKRREVTSSDAHWVEIDLLRQGQTPWFRRRLAPHEYFVHVSPVELRPKGRVWPIRLQEKLPVVGIPLRHPDPDGPLDLQAALDLAYDRGAYDRKVKYAEAPDPPLPPALARWSNKLLKQHKLR